MINVCGTWQCKGKCKLIQEQQKQQKYEVVRIHQLLEYNSIQQNYKYNSRSIIMENKHGRRMELGNSGMCLHQQIERLLAVVLFCHWTAVQCMHVTYSQ